jgi:hypothetical protein
MRNVRILIANEPRAYREVFASALRTIRPCAEIVEAPSEDLDGEVMRFRPDMVLCSNVTPVVESTVQNWVLLYPENEPLVMVSTAGELSTVSDVDLKDIVALVDKTTEMIDNPVRSL